MLLAMVWSNPERLSLTPHPSPIILFSGDPDKTGRGPLFFSSPPRLTNARSRTITNSVWKLASFSFFFLLVHWTNRSSLKLHFYYQQIPETLDLIRLLSALGSHCSWVDLIKRDVISQWAISDVPILDAYRLISHQSFSAFYVQSYQPVFYLSTTGPGRLFWELSVRLGSVRACMWAWEPVVGRNGTYSFQSPGCSSAHLEGSGVGPSCRLQLWWSYTQGGMEDV